ncbi:polyketide cyclase [Cohnella lubricantis]|uniref:Polyketide cyclase n=1 Tax=Cohnella lubricantis TaxID=2163172 RepID=A0A841TF49_9BACL|nr:polyketide cyclase [Cohnella lubricantis]MBB6678599.1 polyketide cyclase [Cohnella lubricantis]MBP2119244.1 hypothetical protein [Cohnella lubricantis]
MKFSNSIVADVSEEALWRAWSDVPSWPRWDTELAEAGLEGPFVTGTIGKMKAKKGRVWSKFRIIEIHRDKGYSCVVPLPGGQLRFDRTFERMEYGTLRVTHDLIFTGGLGWLYALLIGWRTNRIYPQLLRLFVELVREKEREAAASR